MVHVGHYQSESGDFIGFLYENGLFSELPVPIAPSFVERINNEGQIVGTTFSPRGGGFANAGFLLTPEKPQAVPEPSTVLLLCVALGWNHCIEEIQKKRFLKNDYSGK